MGKPRGAETRVARIKALVGPQPAGKTGTRLKQNLGLQQPLVRSGIPSRRSRVEEQTLTL